MPKIHGFTEIRFVEVGFTDPRGYKVELVTDPIVIEHYKDFFERALIKARDQVRLCKELGHHEHCGGRANCERFLARMEIEQYSVDRPWLVRIDIPVGDA